MNSTNNTHPSLTEAGADLAEATGGAMRVLEVGLIVLAALLVSPPLLTIAVLAAVPTLAVAALAAAGFAAIAGPAMLVRRVRAHHRAHGTTMFLHRLPLARR